MLPTTESREILLESCGKVTVSCRKTPEIVRIFSDGFLPTSRTFQQESVGNHGKKFEKFSSGILLPRNHRNYVEPAVSGSGCSTWGIIVPVDPIFLLDICLIWFLDSVFIFLVCEFFLDKFLILFLDRSPVGC